jgi:hypothetical protein
MAQETDRREKYWWLLGVVVPITAALIGVVKIQLGGGQTPIPVTPVETATKDGPPPIRSNPTAYDGSQAEANQQPSRPDPKPSSQQTTVVPSLPPNTEKTSDGFPLDAVPIVFQAGFDLYRPKPEITTLELKLNGEVRGRLDFRQKDPKDPPARLPLKLVPGQYSIETRIYDAQAQQWMTAKPSLQYLRVENPRVVIAQPRIDTIGAQRAAFVDLAFDGTP